MSAQESQTGRSDRHRAVPTVRSDPDPERALDVIIVGHGGAGLELAVQLKAAQPALAVVVLEGQPQLVPERAGPAVSRLSRQAGSLGVISLPDHRVSGVIPMTDGRPHELRIWSFPEEFTLRGRWVVDASGRGGLLAAPAGPADRHRASAVWLHRSDAGDVGHWADHAPGQARVDCRLGGFMIEFVPAPTFRAWIVRSSWGSMSLGLVTDASNHSAEDFGTVGAALRWLEMHAPQCAAAIRAGAATFDDYRTVAVHDSTPSHPAGRWYCRNDAAGPGGVLSSSDQDLQLLGDGLITTMIMREFRGEVVDGAPGELGQLSALVSRLSAGDPTAGRRAVTLPRPA